MAQLVLLGVVLVACGGGSDVRVGALDASMPADASTDADAGALPDLGGRAGLTVTGVSPRSGPFSGGNRVVVRGSGFTEDALVRFGGRLVQPAATTLVDRRSLSVIVPAGVVGSVDVEVEVDGALASRADAYTYAALAVAPESGALAGGTLLTIRAHEAVLDDDVVVEVGGEPCREPTLVTPSELRCKTPPGSLGRVDVVARWPDDDARAPLVAEDAFEYEDPKNTLSGGLSGGPIEGSVNVTVIDSLLGLVVPNAFVILGDALDTPYQGRTDARGQITFSGDDLRGQVTIHAALECFVRKSIVVFDARNVTIELDPLLDPSCGDPGDLTGGGGGRGVLGSFISGELIFPGSEEFAVNGWDVIPEPRAGEDRVAYVFTTVGRIEDTAIPPDASGSLARIVESTSLPGESGYPYSIFSRNAGLAVYAIAGVENRSTGAFVPYVMGVTRDLVTAPGEELGGTDITLDIPLDRELAVELRDVPEPTALGPRELRVQAHVDLGGEGFIVRELGGERFDLLRAVSASRPFRFFAQPAFVGALQDARYELIAGYYSTGSDDEPPYTELRRRGVAPTSEALRIDDLLPIPRALAPADGGELPADRVLRWELPDGVTPDLWRVTVISGVDVFAWEQLVRGDQTQSALPDFAELEGVGDAPEGLLTWYVEAIRVPDFDFDALRYDLLARRFWSHSSAARFAMRR